MTVHHASSLKSNAMFPNNSSILWQYSGLQPGIYCYKILLAHCHFYITNIFTGVGTAFQNREKYLRIEEMGRGLNGLRI